MTSTFKSNDTAVSDILRDIDPGSFSSRFRRSVLRKGCIDARI